MCCAAGRPGSRLAVPLVQAVGSRGTLSRELVVRTQKLNAGVDWYFNLPDVSSVAQALVFLLGVLVVGHTE